MFSGFEEGVVAKLKLYTVFFQGVLDSTSEYDILPSIFTFTVFANNYPIQRVLSAVAERRLGTP